jgi:SAM-dependent methyltransferase
VKSFDEYAAYYDLLYSEKNYAAEAKYVENLLKKFSTKSPEHLLEIGCGTGRHAEYFLNHGYNLLGIDQSEEMIIAAKRRFEGVAHSQFFINDARDFEVNRQFDAAYSLFHVMSYLASVDDLKRCLLRVSKHLKSGGVFLFDCWNTPAVVADPPVVRFKEMKGKGVEVYRVALPSMNDKQIRIDFKIWVHAGGDKNGKKIEETHLLKAYESDEIEVSLNECGLELIHSEPWMIHDEKLSQKHWYATYVARKP